jgi:nucleoid-associated protein YgaU
VRSGDNLYRIAQKTLGDSSKWASIFEANRDVLADPDSLKVGQTLRIPQD